MLSRHVASTMALAAWIVIFALNLSPLSVLGDDAISQMQCKPIGIKSITISWKFTPTQTRKSQKLSVYFCKVNAYDCRNISINYKNGCTVNVTEGVSEYSCNIGQALKLNFPQENSFYYYVKDNILPQIQLARCPVHMLMQCSKPTGLTLTPVGKGKLKLNWSKPTDMGSTADILCYFIEYSREESPKDKIHLHFYNEGKYEYQLRLLMPYQRYHVYLQCALDCAQTKSLPAGPVTARTPEEEPQDQVTFQNWSETEVDRETRNVTIFLKIPDKEKWNGQVRQIRVFCYKDNHLCTNVTLDESVVSDGWRHQQKYSVTFPFLRRNTTYNINADYCNSIACSPRSRNQTIPAPPAGQDGARVESPKPNESLSKDHFVGIGVGCGAVIVLAVIIIILIFRNCNHNNEGRRNLQQVIGPLPPSAPEDVIPEEQADNVYSSANVQVPRVSRSTLNPETTDFQSASVRSINSSYSIGGLTDQSPIRDNNSESFPHHEEGSNQENVALLGKEADSPSVAHKPSQEDEVVLHTPV